MTATEPLSARIAALETAASELSGLEALRQRILDEMTRQQANLADVDERIADRINARIVLLHLTEQANRVFAGGELVRGTDLELPEPHEQDNHAEHVRLRRKVLEDQGFDPNTAAIIANHPEKYPSGPDVLAELAVSTGHTPESPETPKITLNTVETESNAGGGQVQPELTNRQRLEQWIATLTPTDVVTVRDAASATGMAEGSVSSLMTSLVKTGVLERLAGTGLPGIPSQYRLPGSTAEAVPTTSPVQPQQPRQEQPETHNTPSVADVENDPPLTDEEDDDDTTVTTDLPRPSNSARIIEILQREPIRGWTVASLAIEADLDEDAVRNVLGNLGRSSTVLPVPGTYPREYEHQSKTTTTPQKPTNAPTPPTSTLTPIPAKLSVDECEVFDVLRKVPDGLTQRLLGSRLNWGAARTQKAVQSLVKLGHIGHNGDKLRVIPPEMQGTDAA